MSAGDYFLGVELGAEQGDKTRRRRAEGDLSGSDRQPALHARGTDSRSAAMALWREFTAARGAILSLLPASGDHGPRRMA